ncbi:MAG: hypothetical protein NVSMB32_17130 [Actinomycetota bacterium]
MRRAGTLAADASGPSPSGPGSPHDEVTPAEAQAAAHPTGRRTLCAAWGCLLVAWLGFVHPMFAGKVHFPSDIVAINSSPPGPLPQLTSNVVDSDAAFLLYPWHIRFGQRLQAGELPLWDPTRFAGAPLAADLPVGAAYPPNWLYGLGHFERVWTLIWAATLLASLLLTWWFFSVARLHPLAGALGAIVWTFGGFMVSYGMFDAYLGSALWLPLALGGLELARRGRPRWGIPIAGLALALSVLAGHSQITLYVWLAAGIWVGVSTAAAAIRVRRSGRRAILAQVLLPAGTAPRAVGRGDLLAPR